MVVAVVSPYGEADAVDLAEVLRAAADAAVEGGTVMMHGVELPQSELLAVTLVVEAVVAVVVQITVLPAWERRRSRRCLAGFLHLEIAELEHRAVSATLRRLITF